MGQKPVFEVALEIFERQVLVFPLLVVLLACGSFLFGGRCAAWQWWIAVATVVLVPFARRGRWRESLVAAGFFAFLLFALRCLIPPLVLDDPTCVDIPVYHQPMIQLLIEGWNPVADPMAEGITASLGLDLWGMAPLHVAFLPKTMAVFSAVAFSFIQDPFALTFPGPFLLWLGVFLAAIQLFRGFTRLMLGVALVFILPMVDFKMFVDLSMSFASCGLLLAIQEAFRRRKCDWLALTVWAAWMMNLKLNGVLAAFVFCALFVAATIGKDRTEWKRWMIRFAAFGGVLVLLWGLISWNPLGTSWRTYGHPLYPFKTVDAERFPVKDLTWDLGNGNDDYREMGKFGLLAHSYLSPKATVAFYRWKTGRADFEPDCEWWSLTVFPDDSVRAGIWLLFAILLLVPGGRLWAFAGLVLLVLVPDRMAGYTRYQPWLSALGCLAVALGAERAETRFRPQFVRLLEISLVSFLGLSAIVWCWEHARDIECKAAETVLVRPVIRPMFWGNPEQRYQSSLAAKNFVARYNYLTCMENRTRLFVKEAGREGRTKVAPATVWIPNLKKTVDWDERNWRLGGPAIDESGNSPEFSPPENEERWLQTPFGYYVRLDEQAKNIYDCYFWNNRHKGETVFDRLKRQFREVFRAWSVTFPREVWRRLVRKPSTPHP